MIPEEHIPFFITEQLFVLDDSDTSEKPSVEKPSEQGQPAVEEAPQPTAATKVEEPEVLQADIIVVCDKYTPAEKELLSKILGAVKVDINDVLLIEGQPIQTLVYERLIVFGDLSVAETGPERYAAASDKKWLRASTLSELSASQEEKMKLWNALKSWFGIS